MKFFSTTNPDYKVDFQQAVTTSMPADGGLYFPDKIPSLDKDFIAEVPNASLEDVCYEVASHFVGEEIESSELKKIVSNSISFPLPVKKIEEGIYTQELFHGPTWAFKDVGARFMARCLSYFKGKSNEKVTILVATSGDTGGAVASGFFNVPGTEVIILYPEGRVSKVQEQQLTTWGGNISAFEVSGSFDDCQKMVKQAFLDKELNHHYNLSSANSINIARLIPQTFYYFAIYQQMPLQNLAISVPSGNYGNLTAGLLAWKMGLPFHKFIAASNINKIVPDYLKTGIFEPKPSIETLSNAMDVGNPSNFVRIQRLFDDHYEDIISRMEGFWLEDEQVIEVMRRCLKENDYVLDPHGAIGYEALKSLKKEEEIGIFLETAHPVKFTNALSQAHGKNVEFKEKTTDLLSKKPHKKKISTAFNVFKGELLSRLNL